MTIKFTIPDQIEQALRSGWGDVNEAAKAALLAESYRAGKIGLGDVARALNLETRLEAQEWLARRGVPLNYDADDLEEDRRTLGELFGAGL